jgi:UDP-N-acetylmuramate--alanine ligase
MNPQAIKYVYLLGVGGIGMSALARYFLRRGAQVRGYDRSRVALTEQLESEGIDITYNDNPDHIPESWLKESQSESLLVIYTPAIPSTHKQLQFLRGKGIALHKRAAVLGLISAMHPTLAVAGTHGKTTTSTLVAHILQTAGLEPVAFLGGISTNYQTNYLEGSTGAFLVAEADEYDRSFLQLHPQSAIITSVDPDHLDIYGDSAALINSFTEFASRVIDPAKRVLKTGLALPDSVTANAFRYNLHAPADAFAEDIRLEGDTYHFSIIMQGQRWKNFSLGLPGLHNLENAIAAASICWLAGVKEEAIREACQTFKGVKRRFEYIIRRPELIFIDDYAHHPEELKACIESVKALYPQKRISGVFQPHLYSRTRDFSEGFVKSLSLLDELFLLDIYPAREEPIPGVSSAALLEKMSHPAARLCTKEALASLIKASKPEVLLTLGAGDIDACVEPLKKELLTLLEP